VHLTRDKHKVAASYAERWHLNESIVKAYGHSILMKPKIAKLERLGICLDYVNFVEKQIEFFLKINPKDFELPNFKHADIIVLASQYRDDKLNLGWLIDKANALGKKVAIVKNIDEVSTYSLRELTASLM
jgi:hypothetical protein